MENGRLLDDRDALLRWLRATGAWQEPVTLDGLITILRAWQRHTADASMPPPGEGLRRDIVVTVSVPADWEHRLDMQWVLEREIRADRWSWDWPPNAIAQGREPGLSGEASLGATGYTSTHR